MSRKSDQKEGPERVTERVTRNNDQKEGPERGTKKKNKKDLEMIYLKEDFFPKE